MKKQGVHFSHIGESSKEDWVRIYESYIPVIQTLPQRFLMMLRELDRIQGALPISRLQHSLQAATRAYKDHRSDEYIFIALLHDIGSFSSIYSHAEVSASIIKDYVSEELHWVVLYHEVFQSYHFNEQIGRSPDERDLFLGHPYYGTAEEFSALYDAPSWDRGYQHKSLREFEDLLIERIALTFRHDR